MRFTGIRLIAIAHLVCAIAVFLAVVSKSITICVRHRRHGDSQRLESQRTVVQGHVIVVGHIHVRRAFGDGVVQDGVIDRSGGNVLNATLNTHFQRVLIVQHNFSSAVVHPILDIVNVRFRAGIVRFRHIDAVDGVRLAVIRPSATASGDRQLVLVGRIGHRQLTRNQRDVIISLFSERPGSRIHVSGHRALARISDAAGNGDTAN